MIIDFIKPSIVLTIVLIHHRTTPSLLVILTVITFLVFMVYMYMKHSKEEKIRIENDHVHTHAKSLSIADANVLPEHDTEE